MFRFQYSSWGFFVFSSLGEGVFNTVRPLQTTGLLFLKETGRYMRHVCFCNLFRGVKCIFTEIIAVIFNYRSVL
jgi:hypothetical protein